VENQKDEFPSLGTRALSADKEKGFSLIELLVVIGIISLLLAIIVPVVSRARNQARSVVCKSRLHEWGLVFSMYANNNNGHFFSYTKKYGGEDIITVWTDELQEYYDDAKLCFCPMAKKISDRPLVREFRVGGKFLAWSIEGFQGYSGRYGAGSYGLNAMVLTHKTSLEYWRGDNARGAMYVPLVLDSIWYAACPDSTDLPPPYDDIPVADIVASMGSFCINRHNWQVNGVFLDYSVRSVGLKELWKLRWYKGIDTIHQGPSVWNGWPAWMSGLKDY